MEQISELNEQTIIQYKSTLTFHLNQRLNSLRFQDRSKFDINSLDCFNYPKGDQLYNLLLNNVKSNGNKFKCSGYGINYTKY